jgi:tRNA G37 N-methylase Trm5
VFDVKRKVIKALPTSSCRILITFTKSVVKKDKSFYLIHEVTNDLQAGESGVDAINLCYDRKVLEMHHILSNYCFGISQVL